MSADGLQVAPKPLPRRLLGRAARAGEGGGRCLLFLVARFGEGEGLLIFLAVCVCGAISLYHPSGVTRQRRSLRTHISCLSNGEVHTDRQSPARGSWTAPSGRAGLPSFCLPLSPRGMVQDTRLAQGAGVGAIAAGGAASSATPTQS